MQNKINTRKKNANFLLDFTGVYDDEPVKDKNTLTWIDCTDIDGCDMYCSASAEKTIWQKTANLGIHGIHFLDSGNYHYVTKIMTDHIETPFTLVVFDHHTDMQKPMIDMMTSCGDWALKVLNENVYLKQLILIGPDEKDINAIDYKNENDKLLTFSSQEIMNNTSIAKTAKIKSGYPVYISIDKDILNRDISETNWSQGNLNLNTLENILGTFLKKTNVIGIDICGECDRNMSLPEYMEAEEKNEALNEELYQYIIHYGKSL